MRAEVEACLSRIEDKAHLGAFLEVFASEALQRADDLDAAVSRGEIAALTGVVVGIKDNICYKNHRASAGSKILEGFVSLYSATVVERLLEHGAVVIGRLNCDEFAMGSSNENSAFGPVRNPLNPARVPGGSSGGSAAAVAFGGCHASLGTDTGGSVRQPASYCGLVGVKPTYGRVSRLGIVAYASSFDQVGVFARTVEDAALVTTCISGADAFDATCTALPGDPLWPSEEAGKRPFRLAYSPLWLQHPSLDPNLRQQMNQLLEWLSDQGQSITAVDPEGLEVTIPAYYILATAEASSNLSRYSGLHYGYRKPDASSLESTLKGSRSAGFGPEVQRRIMLGTFVLSEGYYDAYYAKAQKVRRQLKERFDGLFESCDAFLLPTTVGAAFELGAKTNDPLAMYLEDQFTVLANLMGLPAISVPLGLDQDGMPLGVQVMCKPFADRTVFEIAALLSRKATTLSTV